MCGLFGFIDIEGKVGRIQKRQLANSLSQLSWIRGEDATGYAYLENSKLKLTKAVKPSPLFPPRLINPSILLGHTRLATIGDPYLWENAHPFLSRCGRYALAHNGIATPDFLALQNRLGALDGETDSEGMLRYLEASGMDSEALGSFAKDWRNSSWAISILDKRNQSLVLFHNGDRAIYLAYLSGLGMYVYASTRRILLQSLIRADFCGRSLRRIDRIPAFVRYELSLDGRVTAEPFRSYPPQDFLGRVA